MLDIEIYMNVSVIALLATVASIAGTDLYHPAQLPSSHKVRWGHQIPFGRPFTGLIPKVNTMSKTTSSREAIHDHFNILEKFLV